MPDDANPLHTLIQCTRRCYSFLSGVVCSLVSRRCTDLVCSPFGASNKFPLKKDNNLTVMAARETIDIDSSDSESWDLTEYKELNKDLSPSQDSGDSASVRVLPPSITGVNRNQTGPRNHEFPPLERPSYSNGSSSRADQHTEDYKKHAPPISSTRTLPLSLQPAMHRSRSRNTSETASSSQTHDRGKSHSYAWPDISSSSSSRNPTSHPNAWPDISSSSRNPTRDHFGRTRDDAVIFSENNGTNRSNFFVVVISNFELIQILQFFSFGVNLFHILLIFCILSGFKDSSFDFMEILVYIKDIIYVIQKKKKT